MIGTSIYRLRMHDTSEAVLESAEANPEAAETPKQGILVDEQPEVAIGTRSKDKPTKNTSTYSIL